MRLAASLSALVACAALASMVGCNVVPSRDPTGESLPDAAGRTLAGDRITLAGALDGRPAVFFLPFTGDAQLDGDRWALGLHQLGTPIRTFELGVVPSTAGVLLAPVVDHARRKARAEVTWPTTLVFIGDPADAIATQTGMGRAEFVRVLLVDGSGRIVWFNDEGFTPDRVADLDRRARELAAAPES
jgi:hypothetical protein